MIFVDDGWWCGKEGERKRRKEKKNERGGVTN